MRRRILGLLDYGNYRQKVTLIDTINGNRRLYRPNIILIGGHFETDEETVFESVIVRLRDAAPWVDRKAITVDDDRPVGGVERRDIACRLDVPERSHARFSRGEIDLAFHWSRHDVELERFAVEYWPEFTIEYDERASLDEIIEDAGNLQSLSSLCVDRSDVFISLRLYRSDHPVTNLNGSPFEGTRRPIEFKAHARTRAAVQCKANRRSQGCRPLGRLRWRYGDRDLARPSAWRYSYRRFTVDYAGAKCLRRE
ncbi:ApeA N-terminal domain 1-containing protein [Actinoplanes italicus]|uniref:ApeA N-terminal domain-containing protein n=1 Tax=Actinoplanes italicus TaxID=113567 RepID=A0A2T0KFF2_9ACTN|nr:hypothetical protein CLV67_105256 [Actinoplanes italicus]